MNRPRLHFVGHSTVLVELGGVRVLTDPVLRDRVGPLRRVVPPPPVSAHSAVDLVLVSHAHHDHLDLPSLRGLIGYTALVVPPGLLAFLSARGFGRVAELAPGEALQVGGLTVTATRAAHDGRRLLGPISQAVGYVLEGEGRRVYFAGDTDLFPQMRDIGAGGLDVAFIPVWGWGPMLGPGHLDPYRGAEAVARLRPRLAVPIHWGTYAPWGMAGRMRRQLTEPPCRFGVAVSARRLPSRVLVAAPGSRVVGP